MENDISDDLDLLYSYVNQVEFYIDDVPNPMVKDLLRRATTNMKQTINELEVKVRALHDSQR